VQQRHAEPAADGDGDQARRQRAGGGLVEQRAADVGPAGTGLLKPGCVPDQPNLTPDFKLVIRTIGTGTERVLPLPPQVKRGGLFSPISHLSWGSDRVNLAVSTLAVQDNEGWGLYLVNTSIARYYVLPGPDGNLFISRACCAGVPVRLQRPLAALPGWSGPLRRTGREHAVQAGHRADRGRLDVAAGRVRIRGT